MPVNHELLEVADICANFIPVDMQTGANAGIWFDMQLCDRVVCVLYKAVGTGGDDPVLTLSQGLDVNGTTPKGLNFTRIRQKIGTITTAANQVWTIITQAAGSTYTPTSAASAAIFAIDVKATDLDMANAYRFVNFNIPDTGTNAQLGCSFYIPYGLKYQQSIPINSMV